MKIPAPSCPKPADKHTWQTLGLAQGHAPWVGCGHCHPGDSDGTGGLKSPAARPTTQHVWLGAFSAKTSLPNWTGLGLGGRGGLPPALPVVPVCVCLHPGPTIIYNISIPSHHTVQTRQRWEGNSRETKLRVVSVALYFNHRRPTQVQRTVHLMNKRNKRKWVFTSHFNSHRRKLDGDPQYGNGGEPSPHQHS